MDGTLPAGARHDLTDEQWAILASLLEALLPVGKKPGRPRRWTLRQLIDGIRFRTRTGCPWRDVPERYGSWQSVYGLFRTWQLTGVWAAILTGRSRTGPLPRRLDDQGCTWPSSRAARRWPPC